VQAKEEAAQSMKDRATTATIPFFIFFSIDTNAFG
jgi:hypothetical protein